MTTNKRTKTQRLTDTELRARSVVEEIIEQEPRLKAVRNARRQQASLSSLTQSLKTFRQRLKN